MTHILTIRRGETQAREATLRDANGDPVDLTTVSGNPKLYARKRNAGTNLIDGVDVTIVGDPTEGKVSWSPSAAAVADVHVLYGHITVTRPGGVTEKYPSEEDAEIHVVEAYDL